MPLKDIGGGAQHVPKSAWGDRPSSRLLGVSVGPIGTTIWEERSGGHPANPCKVEVHGTRPSPSHVWDVFREAWPLSAASPGKARVSWGS